MRKLLSLALAALGMAGLAQAQEYSLHGRVSHDEGAMLIRGGNGSDWAHATNNGLVLSGDTLWIDEAGVGEVEFPGGNFLRLADRSKIDVSSVDPISLRAWTGAFYVQRLARSQGVLVVETPAATIGVRPDTSVRIDVNSGGLTTVSVRWGEAEVRGPVGGAVIVTGGRRSYIEAGLLPSEPVSFDRAVEDSFDSWSRNRSDYLANGVTAVPAEVQVAPTTIGVSDLNNYGEWVYIDRRPYWRPTVIVDYVPYRLGYWNYVPSYGHVWCGTAPFSYVTSHYGRWTHHATYGWCWGGDGALRRLLCMDPLRLEQPPRGGAEQRLLQHRRRPILGGVHVLRALWPRLPWPLSRPPVGPLCVPPLLWQQQHDCERQRECLEH
jgi:hypothetical protein